MATQASTDGAPQATTQADGNTTQSIVNMHRYKIQAPTFTGEYGTFEEWKYKFQAYMGLMDYQLPQLLENSENSTTIIREADLVAAANTTPKKQTSGYNCPLTWDTSWLTYVQDQQQKFADNTRHAMALKSIENYVVDSQFH